MKKLSLILLFIATAIAMAFFVMRLPPCDDYKITQISSFSEVAQVLQTADAETIVFFDVDAVLISPFDQLLRDRPWTFKFLAFLKHPRLLYDKLYVEDQVSLMLEQAKAFVIEPDIVDIIEDLEQKGVMVFGLTSIETGSYGVIQSMPEWRYAMLKSLDITFTQEFPETYFTSLPAYRNNYPGIYKGIICCNQQPKGEVMGAFLDTFGLAHETIIFFDDDITNCRSVAAACKKRNIVAQAYQYLVPEQKLPGTWNLWRAVKQFDYLLAHGTWLSDEEMDGGSIVESNA